MRIVVAPDSMGGRLSASSLADAIVAGWRRTRPDDDLVVVPLSDGGEGFLDVVQDPRGRRVHVEVCGPLGHPVEASLSLSEDGRTAFVESASACGLARVGAREPDPLRATTWGVGELLDAAREAGAGRVVVGLGGSATVDGGAGALSGLGYRVTVGDGSGLKIGGADLGRVARVVPGWRHPGWSDVEVVLLADVRSVLADAATVFGPQKGADADAVATLAAALQTWADVVERDLGGGPARDAPGTGAAGGLGFGLAAALGASLQPGAPWVADHVGLDAALEGADLVITGEGRLDVTSGQGKVVGEVVSRAAARGVPVHLVVGRDARGSHELGGPIHGISECPAEDPEGATARVSAEAAELAEDLPGRLG